MVYFAAMQTSDFYFELPDALIAQHPPAKRGDSRLLHVHGASGLYDDRHFSDLPELLQPGDLLVFNNTRVMKARLFGTKETGGKVEILIERLISPHTAMAHVRASKSPKEGGVILVDDWRIEVTGREASLFHLQSPHMPFTQLMETAGHMPLPPYIARADEVADTERYQTVYAEREGAVAAPTAGLHFTPEMLARLRHRGIDMAHVTLHVGAGTFQNLRAEHIEENRLHSERVEVTQACVEAVNEARAAGGRVIAIGTTSVRSLECASTTGELRPFSGETDLFIQPGYRFRSVDAMITNFHLPQSSLLMLVSAFAGRERILDAYAHAVREKYRFFSYGDAMFLTPGDAS